MFLGLGEGWEGESQPWPTATAPRETRREGSRGDRGEDPQVVEANSSSSASFSSGFSCLGTAYLQLLQQLGHWVSLEGMFLHHCPPSFPAMPAWLLFPHSEDRRHTGILFPTDRDQGGWTRAARAAVAASPPGRLDQQAQAEVFPSPRLPDKA